MDIILGIIALLVFIPVMWKLLEFYSDVFDWIRRVLRKLGS